MPNLEHLYVEKARHRIKLAIMAVVLILGSMSTALLGAPKNAAALGTRGPDPADFSNTSMVFVVDNSSYVYTPNTRFLMYFPNPTGNTVTLYSPGLHDSEEYEGIDTYDQIYSPGFAGDPDVTSYTVEDAAGTPLAPTQTAKASEDNPFTFNFNFPATAVRDTATGYYVAQMYAHMIPAMPNDVHNGFNVIVSAGAIVGFDSKSSATEFGIQERINPRDYSNWHLKFGADCSVLPPNGADAHFKWYDPDNGNAGVQPNKMSFEIWDYTTIPKLVHIDAYSGTDFTSGGATIGPSGYKVTPGGASVSRTDGDVRFHVMPAHIYQVIFTGVYSNNTLQFQLPFDSIFYNTRGCQSFQLTPERNATVASPLQAGTTYTNDFDAWAENHSSSTSDPYTLSVALTTNTAGVALSGAGPWPMPALAPGGISTVEPFTVTIPTTAPEGSQFCFVTTVTPASSAGGSATSSPMCFTVYHVYTPAIIGNNGDVHAGGSLCASGLGGVCTGCTLAPNQGTSTNGASYGQYVVSATGVVSNFGSNNTPLSTSATLGSYNTVCRPNLVSKAQSYIASNGTPARGSRTTTIASLAGLADANGVVYINGNLTLTGGGSIAKNLTVYVTGTVTTTGNIIVGTPSVVGKSQPSVGIISALGINIAPAATRVDAYLFSNTTINTCYAAGTNPPVTYYAPCASVLTVNGFLMANAIQFYRYGVKNATGGAIDAEIVNLAPQLYINPPELFEGGQDQSLLNDIGERPPLN